MDPHPVVEEPSADPLAGIPDLNSDALSFDQQIEDALANLHPDPEPPAAEPEAAAEPESTAVEDPIESLTGDVGDDWTPKAAARFQQLKAELKTSRSELDQLRQAKQQYESKIQELTGLAESKDVEQLQQRVAEYEQQLAVTNLEKLPAYQEAVTAPMAALMEQASEIADKYDVDADSLIDIIALTDARQQEEQLAELLPNATDRDKARIFRIMEDVEPILQRRADMFANAEQALAEAKQLEESRLAVEAAQRAKVRENVTRNVVERVRQRLPFLDGLEGVNLEAVQKNAAAVDPATLHPVDNAYNVVAAQLLPSIVKSYATLQREVDALTERLASYEQAEPSPSGQTKSSVGGNGLPDSLSFEERINAALAGR